MLLAAAGCGNDDSSSDAESSGQDGRPFDVTHKVRTASDVKVTVAAKLLRQIEGDRGVLL